MISLIKKSVITSLLVASVLSSYVGIYRFGWYLILGGAEHPNTNTSSRRRQQGSKRKRSNANNQLFLPCRYVAKSDTVSQTQRRLKAKAGNTKQRGDKEKVALALGTETEELVTIPEFYKKSNRCSHSFKDQVTFFHVGKAGGGTLSSELRNNKIFLSGSHPKPSSPRIGALKNGPSKTLIINVRDPIDRFLSAFRWRLAVLCSPDDGRDMKKKGAANHPHEVCKTSTNRVIEEKMLRETYNSDPNALAEALCQDSPLHEDAVEDYRSIGHSLTLVEWLEFLVNPKMVNDVTENGIENFIAIPLEKRKQGGNNSSIIEGNENQSSSLFEQHIQQLGLHLLSTRYGTQKAKEILNHKPQDDVRSSHKEMLEHSSARYYNTTAIIVASAATTNDSDRKEEQQQQAQQSPPAFLSPLGECCLARHLHKDYRLIQTMLGDTKGTPAAATTERKKKKKSADGQETIALEPLVDAHPVLEKACTWGSIEQQMLCRSDLQSMVQRRAQYLDLSLGSCAEVVRN